MMKLLIIVVLLVISYLAY
ncbi:type I toxin-antitoxin system Ibs family toxin [Escherichia coli]|nr:type I toxin-antitoxin system Ibs family toxin [Escherichia coli]EJK8857005.1 type I toxin-antitoxin system Ibs family toxin [Escherichia coli]